MNPPAPVTHASARPSRKRRILVGTAFVGLSLVTLIALLYAIENWRGKRAWEAYERNSTARGEVLELRKLVPEPVPDEENFVATPLVRLWFSGPPAGFTNRWPDDVKNAASRLLNSSKSRREWQLTDLVAWKQALLEQESASAQAASRRRSQSPTNETAEAQSVSYSPGGQSAAARGVLAKLDVYEPALNEFRATISRPKAHYPVKYDFEQPFAILLPHLAQVRSVLQVLNLRACAELATGDNDAAFQDTMLALKFVESLDREPFLISQLVRVACLAQAAQPIWEGIVRQRWTADQLLAFQNRLGAMNFSSELPHSMRLERAAGLATIETVRLRRDGPTFTDGGDPNPLASLSTRLAPSGWFYFEKLGYARIFDRILPAMQPPLNIRAVQDASAQIEQETKGGVGAVWQHRVFAALLTPAFQSVAIKVGAAQVLVEQAETACALERARLETGAFPESLDQLVPKYLKAPPHDLFAGAPMRYSRTATNGFLLYSIGADGKDNGGAPGKQMLDTKSGDLPWRVDPVPKYD